MHPEAIPQKNKEIFSALSEFRDFYLAGGTALALQIGHRVSVDFDMFSDRYIPKELLSQVEKTFPESKIEESVNNSRELTLFINGVKLTFLHYPFPLISDPVEYQDLKLLSVQEIAATKAYTIGRRGSLKDYVDLYYILSQKHSDINEIIKTASRKFKDNFNDRLFLEQLIYLDDLENEEIVFLQNKVNRNDLKDFFQKQVKELEL